MTTTQLLRPADIRLRDPYGMRMRNIPAPESGAWATLIRTHRKLAGLTQAELAVRAKVSRETVWRWENGKQVPEDGQTVDNVCDALSTVDRDEAFIAAGLASLRNAPVEDPYAYVREMGLDPANRVVRRILALRVDEEFRMRMLRRERQLQLRDEQARLDDIEWTIDQQHRDEGDDKRKAS